jgi:hypothetical protein
MFNLGGALFIAFFAYASIALRRGMLETRLGHGVSVLAVLLYGTRAVGEFVFVATPRPLIVATCVAMAAIYAAVLLLPASRKTEVAASASLAPTGGHAAGS